MLGRKSYTQEELDTARGRVRAQLAAYRELAAAVEGSAAHAALEAFEPHFATAMALELDRLFVHRLRQITGKDGNALNELEMVAGSLLTTDELQPSSVIKLDPETSVLGIAPGERIVLDADSLERLAGAFFEQLESRFVGVPAGG
jgi:hypothetical protein